MDAYRRANRLKWDELVDHHVGAESYGVDALRRGERRLHPIEEGEIGDVAGLDVLHLQCHFGVDSLILAQRGARVTGLDFSPRAIETARALAEELGLPGTFVEGDLYAAPDLIDGPFDLVFTTWGTICWLPDLPVWAGTAAHFLKPGGRFYFADAHPMARVWDPGKEAAALPFGTLRTSDPYFGATEPFAYEDDGDYASDARTVSTRTYEWAHSVSDIVNAVSGAGLTFEFLHEHAEIAWQLLPILVPTAGSQYGWPEGFAPALPLSLSFMARKPG
ncbi:MAG: class I SAM-dependent methyltransferase [Alphaproteobacteria bacterium]|nr:class I SAM-dependent methyltransferase [Alphaproteobacteria bacterium]